MGALLSAAGLVFAAELGDKTQLVVLTLGAGRRRIPALAGLAATIALLQALAVLLGDALGDALPATAVGIGSGLLFLAFAVWTWASVPGAEDGHDDPSGPGSLLGLMGAFFLAELGDKTNLATASLATRADALATWAGSSLGFLAATALALLAADWLRRVVGQRRLAQAGSLAFAVAGVATLAVTLVG